VRIRAVEGPLLRGCAAADGRETAGYLFRRPGPGCHVARLLDEPTASLDPAATKAIEEVIRSVAARGIKVVMSTHDLGEARRKARSSSRREGSSIDATGSGWQFPTEASA